MVEADGISSGNPTNMLAYYLIEEIGSIFLLSEHADSLTRLDVYDKEKSHHQRCVWKLGGRGRCGGCDSVALCYLVIQKLSCSAAMDSLAQMRLTSPHRGFIC